MLFKLFNDFLVGGCIYPKDQIKVSVNDFELTKDSKDNSINLNENINTSITYENTEDNDFIKKLDQQLENIESKLNLAK